jgi:hypothetical protein
MSTGAVGVSGLAALAVPDGPARTTSRRRWPVSEGRRARDMLPSG